MSIVWPIYVAWPSNVRHSMADKSMSAVHGFPLLDFRPVVRRYRVGINVLPPESVRGSDAGTF